MQHGLSSQPILQHPRTAYHSVLSHPLPMPCYSYHLSVPIISFLTSLLPRHLSFIPEIKEEVRHNQPSLYAFVCVSLSVSWSSLATRQRQKYRYTHTETEKGMKAKESITVGVTHATLPYPCYPTFILSSLFSSAGRTGQYSKELNCPHAVGGWHRLSILMVDDQSHSLSQLQHHFLPIEYDMSLSFFSPHSFFLFFFF